MTRKIFRKCIIVILGLMIFGAVSLFVRHLGRVESVEPDTEVTNMNEYMNGDCVLVIKANGIKTFPFVFGESLYLYDITNDKWKLVKNRMIPFSGFGYELAVDDKNVYYNKYFESDGIELYSRGIGAIGFEKEILDQVGIYTISSDYMFYLKKRESYDWDNYIYRMDRKTGKKEVYMKGQFSFVLRQDHGCLYTFDNQKKEAMEITENKKEVTKCKGIKEPQWIGSVDKDSFIIVMPDEIVSYDKRKSTKKYYVKDIKEEESLINDKAILKDGNLYFSDMGLRMYRLNLKNGKKETVFSLRDQENIKKYVENGDNEPEIRFTKSYITVDLCYDHSSKRKYFVYSYDGELIREFSLPEY